MVDVLSGHEARHKVMHRSRLSTVRTKNQRIQSTRTVQKQIPTGLKYMKTQFVTSDFTLTGLTASVLAKCTLILRSNLYKIFVWLDALTDNYHGNWSQVGWLGD